MVIFRSFFVCLPGGTIVFSIENEPKKLLAVRPRPLKVALKMRPSPWLSRHGATVRVGGVGFFFMVFFAKIFLVN